MMQCCPVCEFTLSEYTECPRCHSDLSLLSTIQKQSRSNLITALQSFVHEDYKQANQHLEIAVKSKNDTLTLAVNQLLLRQSRQQASVHDTDTDQIVARIWCYLKPNILHINDNIRFSMILKTMKLLFSKVFSATQSSFDK